MEAVDIAPTSALQELILADTAPEPDRLGPVTRPLLDAPAVARLRDLGVHPAVLAACCAHEGTLDDLAAEFATWPHPLGPLEDGIASWHVRQRLAANPHTPESAVWRLATSGPSPPSLDRLVADAAAGRDGHLCESLRSGTTPVPVLNELASTAPCAVLARLAGDDRHGRLAAQLDRNPHNLALPALAVAWLRHAPPERLAAFLGTERPALARAWVCAPEVLDALAGRLYDEPRLAGQVATWFGELTGELFSVPEGIRLARSLLASPASPGRLAAVRDAAVSSAPSATDELLAEYPPLAVPVLELLRRRRLLDPAAWRFVISAGPFPGPAGALADLAAAAVGDLAPPR